MRLELTEDYLTGEPEIDKQHLKLCECINTLQDGLEAGLSIEKLMSSLDFLTNHTLQHFAYEQKMMLDMNYPDLEEHIEHHRELIKELGNLKEDFIRHVKVNQEDKFTGKFLDLLKDWLLNHITEEDFKLKPYL